MVAIKCNEEGTMLKHCQCLYLTCVYGNSRCMQSGMQCTKQKFKILVDVKHVLYLFLLCCLFCLLLSCVACFPRSTEAMAPLQVPKKFKLKFFLALKFHFPMLMPTKLPKIVKTQVGMMAQEDERWKGVRLFRTFEEESQKML